MAMPKPTPAPTGDVPSRPSRPSLVPAGFELQPTAGASLDADEFSMRFEAALAAHARTEAALVDLSRTVKFLSASIASIREANQRLGDELGDLLGRLKNDDASLHLRSRIRHLENAVVETSRAAAREREFLVADHDAFILALIADHERELMALRERLCEPERLSEPEPHSDTRLSQPFIGNPVSSTGLLSSGLQSNGLQSNGLQSNEVGSASLSDAMNGPGLELPDGPGPR